MRRLTLKQKGFIKEYVKTKNGTEAVLKTYNTTDKSTAGMIASENLSKPKIQEALEKALVKHDITLDKSLIPIAKGLEAKRIKEVEGDFYETDVDDIDTQLKASDRALKLLGITSQQGNATAFVNVINIAKEKYKL